MRKLLLLRSYWLTAFHTSGASSSSYLSTHETEFLRFEPVTCMTHVTCVNCVTYDIYGTWVILLNLLHTIYL